jgi:hypothetical protein
VRVGYTVWQKTTSKIREDSLSRNGSPLGFFWFILGWLGGKLACCTVVSNVVELGQAHGAGYEWIRCVDAEEEEAVWGEEIECQAVCSAKCKLSGGDIRLVLPGTTRGGI